MNTKLIVLLSAGCLMAGCTKKPDSPAPQATQAPTDPTQPPTTNPPPVTNCQGATVQWDMPVTTIDGNVTATYVVPNFEVSCGDTLQVLIRNFGVPPGTPWTVIHEGDNGATYYTLLNQTVTMHNMTGSMVNITIQAILK